MENYNEEICPYCKTEIKADDAVKICPACGIAHHKNCWEENNGCTTFGCSEQHYEGQRTNCSNCGAIIENDQAFCSKCGTPKGNEKKNVCGKCGAELQEGQAFCHKCGKKAGLAVNLINNQLSTETTKKKSKKLLILLVILGIIVFVEVIAVAVKLRSGWRPNFISSQEVDFSSEEASVSAEESDSGSDEKPNFRDMDLDLCGWSTIASDGLSIEVDTNPYDDEIDNLVEFKYPLSLWASSEDPTAYYNERKNYQLELGNTRHETFKDIEKINTKLGFSSALYTKMERTTALQGIQTDSNDEYTVSWTYHPDKGLEVLYEVNY